MGRFVDSKGYSGRTNYGPQIREQCMKFLLNHTRISTSPARSQLNRDSDSLDIRWLELLMGSNVLTVNGHQHRVQRKILNPAFTTTHMRNLMPTVSAVSLELKEAIARNIQAEGGSTGVIDVYKLLNVAALEVMGQAGFGYSFNALKPGCEDIEYLNASHDMTTLLLKLWYITPVLPWLMKVGSARFRRAIVECIPFGPIRALRNVVDILNEEAMKVYHIKKKELEKATPDSDDYTNRDVMSSLLMQNNVVAPEEAMNEEEVISQVNALIFAAHDTTSAALARTVYLLGEYPDVQSELRREIYEAHETYGEELSYDQLNSLPYLDAVCRESLRLYAPGLFLLRVAQDDWTIPLLYPGKSSNGTQTITHVSVKKGSHIYLSLDGANRGVSGGRILMNSGRRAG